MNRGDPDTVAAPMSVPVLQRIERPAGVMVLYAPSAPLLYSRIEGRVDDEVLGPLRRACDHAVSRGPAWFFNDWELLEHYTTRGRLEITQWALRHRARIVESHVLVRSRLVAMGVGVANLALGGIYRTHRRRIDFEQALGTRAEALGLALPPLGQLRRGT